MKKLICSAVALAALASTAIAPAAVAEDALPQGVFITKQTAEEYLAKDHLIGMKVKGPDGKIVGDIEDLIVSDGNTVVGIVMGTGGFLGMGEKLDGLDVFDAQRVAGRILGQGDIVSLVEKAKAEIDQVEAEKLAKKMAKGQFDLEDLAGQLRQLQRMGGLGGLMGMMPGVTGMSMPMR